MVNRISSLMKNGSVVQEFTMADLKIQTSNCIRAQQSA